MTTRQRGTLVATGLGLFMIFLDALIVNVALPDIQSAFRTDESGVQWIVTAYSVGMAVSIMAWASSADRWGRRRVYVGGLTVFVLASLVCGFAPSIGVMNAARAAQGLAAAAVNVTSLALVSAAFTDRAAKARAIGLWSAIAATGVALGPTLGGILTDEIGWRSVFFVNLLFGVAALALTVRYVAESRGEVDHGFDLPGQAAYVIAVGGFAFAVIEGPSLGWASPGVLAAWLAFGGGFVVFVWHELRTEQPMMDLRLFRSRTYSLAIVSLFTMLFGMYGMLLVISQLWQNVLGFSVLTTGLLLMPLALVQMVLSPLAGRWIPHVGARRLMLGGMGVLVGGLALQIVGISVSDPVMVVGVWLIGAAQALTVTPATTVAMSSVPEDRAGMASGIMNSQRALGSTAGYAVLGTILAAWLTASLGPTLETILPDATERDAVSSAVIDSVNPRAYAAEIGPGRPIPSASGATREEIAAATEADFRHGVQLALAVAALIAAIVLLIDWRAMPPDRPEPNLRQ